MFLPLTGRGPRPSTSWKVASALLVVKREEGRVNLGKKRDRTAQL